MHHFVRPFALLVAVALLATAAHHLAPRPTPRGEPDEPQVLLPTDLHPEYSEEGWEVTLDELRRIDQRHAAFVATDPEWIEVPPPPAPPVWWERELPTPPRPDPAPPPASPPLDLRTWAAAQRGTALAEAGGSARSQQAVERALAWLARNQNDDGSWTFDGPADCETAAATGAALLPYLGAAFTHRTRKYAHVVERGVRWLLEDQRPDGSFATAPTATGHAFAAIALVECYGLTRDRNLLIPARAALGFIRDSQNADGGWGERPGEKSDPAATGWTLQALHAGRAAKLIDRDARVFEKAVALLDRPAADPVAVMARIHANGWQGDRPEVAAALAKPERFDSRHLYHATQVMFLRGGIDWDVWNAGTPGRVRVGGVRDGVVARQIAANGRTHGSWDPDEAVGREWGRLGTTVLAALTLQVYYRYPREWRLP